jgi:hypothetical protein
MSPGRVSICFRRLWPSYVLAAFGSHQFILVIPQRRTRRRALRYVELVSLVKQMMLRVTSTEFIVVRTNLVQFFSLVKNLKR